MRLAFLSRDFLINAVTNELVQEHFGCLRLASNALKLMDFSSVENLPQSPRKGLETHAIVACSNALKLMDFSSVENLPQSRKGLETRATVAHEGK